MAHFWIPILSILVLLLFGASAASNCSATLTPTQSIQPSIASGYQAALVATGLTAPRSIKFDTSGNLLVVQAGVGITNLVLQDNGGICVNVQTERDIVKDGDVCPGIDYDILAFGTDALGPIQVKSWAGTVSGRENTLCFLDRSRLLMDL